MQIDELVETSHKIAKRKGFWEEDRHVSECIALMHSELSEALEEARKGNDVGEELADCVIRIADFCGRKDIDLDTEIERKLEKNKSRPYKHGKKF